MKSAIRSPNLEIWPFVRFWLIKRPLRPLAGPSGHPPAPKRRKRAREAVAEALAVTRKKFFGKPDGPAPSARMTERARATARVCHGCRGSFGRRPESCFGTGKLPAPKLRKRARATRPSQAVAEASTVAEKIFSASSTGPTPASKRRERAFGQPDGPE